MKISEFLKNYNLHDSLIERISHNEENKTVTIEIDFCYWQQRNYTDDMPETGMITLIFSDVDDFIYEPFEINSDEIIKVENDSNSGLYIEFFNDVDEECHSLSIKSKEVHVFSEGNRIN